MQSGLEVPPIHLSSGKHTPVQEHGPTQAFCHLFSSCSCSASAPLQWFKSLDETPSSARQQNIYSCTCGAHLERRFIPKDRDFFEARIPPILRWT